LITQPQKVILAPVDDSGTMKELCSDTCLTSVKSKMLYSHCKLCGKYCPTLFWLWVKIPADQQFVKNSDQPVSTMSRCLKMLPSDWVNHHIPSDLADIEKEVQTAARQRDVWLWSWNCYFVLDKQMDG
ncbi:hypothetical protein XENOCAPTIV_024602, partial [Xenoophorus captivus]